MMIKKFKKFYRRIFPEVPVYLKKEADGFESILDLGCGFDSMVKLVKSPQKVGVELFKPYLEKSKKKKIHDKYIQADITKLKLEKNSFEVVVALDVLEHLSKKDGLKLLKNMEYWASKKIIIYTPNGFLHQDEFHENPHQIHKSGWTVKDLKNLGFKVYGVHGLKNLRGELAEIKFKPTPIWLVISDMTQKFTYYFPEFAFQLFAVKNVE